MNTKARKVEVPGEAQAPDPSEDQARTDAVNAQVEATKGLVGSAKALDWGHLTTPNNILDKINNNPDNDLPDASEINVANLKRGEKVLTKSGWVWRD